MPRISAGEPLPPSVFRAHPTIVSAHGLGRDLTVQLLAALRPPSKKYVESLQARIRHLEAQVVSLGSKPAYDSGKIDLIAEDNEQDESGADDDQDPLSDLTVLAGRLNVIDDGQLHYFGSQSSYNLVREPLREADPHEPSHKAQVQGLLATAQLGKTVSISDELQDHLLDLYWRWQNPWNYVIHKGAFLKSFKGEGDGKYCSPLLLCSIFAIAARYSDRPELRSIQDDPNTTGDAFCEQAKILMLYEAEAPTITTVQAACLLALRIMSDGKEALGWLYAGTMQFPGMSCLISKAVILITPQAMRQEWHITLAFIWTLQNGSQQVLCLKKRSKQER